MPLNPLYLSTIRRVHVEFDLSAHDLDPDKVSLALKIKPSRSARRGDERRNPRGTLLSPYKEGWWQLSSEGKVKSKDINKHFEYLLRRLLPHKETILSFAKDKTGETYFDVLWESTYLYAGSGPLLSSQSIKGMAELNASIGFDIYQIDEG
jgi:uncharacterized protein DUF4279